MKLARFKDSGDRMQNSEVRIQKSEFRREEGAWRPTLFTWSGNRQRLFAIWRSGSEPTNLFSLCISSAFRSMNSLDLPANCGAPLYLSRPTSPKVSSEEAEGTKFAF